MPLFKQMRTQFIKRIRRRAENGGKDVWSVAKGIAYGYGLYYGGWLVLVLAGLAILSFTNWLGGPFLAAEVLFYLIAGSVGLLLLHIFWLWRALQGKLDDIKQAQQRHQARDAGTSSDNIREVEVIDKSDD